MYVALLHIGPRRSWSDSTDLGMLCHGAWIFCCAEDIIVAVAAVISTLLEHIKNILSSGCKYTISWRTSDVADDAARCLSNCVNDKFRDYIALPPQIRHYIFAPFFMAAIVDVISTYSFLSWPASSAHILIVHFFNWRIFLMWGSQTLLSSHFTSSTNGHLFPTVVG